MTPLQSSLHCVFTTRIVINIRVAGERLGWDQNLDNLDNLGIETSIHTWHQDNAAEGVGLALVPRSEIGDHRAVEYGPPATPLHTPEPA